MNALREALRDYLELRRGLGYKLEDAGLQLPRFFDFLETRGASHITTALPVEWAQQPTAVQPRSGRGALVEFGASRATAMPAIPLTEIRPSACCLTGPHAPGRLYSDEEVRQLLAAALKLPTNWHRTPLYSRKFHCLIGLLSTTGMRMSEALDLQVSDVDLDQALLTIRGAKIRCIPLHPSTRDVLADYLRRRIEFFGAVVSPYVFVSSRGNRLDQAGLHRTFYALSRNVGLRAADASRGPRLHDFRHRFAVKVLTAWYESGQDAARLLPVLSTYLGHVRVEDTYWYLSAWPELMSHAMARLERRWGASS